MFAKTIIDSDAFLDMPLSAQALYFHLSMRADDDGFINNPKKLQRMVGASDDDFKLLIVKRFVLTFDSGVIVIKHWRMHNYIQKDRYKPTVYQEEKSLIAIKENGVYTDCIQNGYSLDTQDSIELSKDSIELGKDNIEISSSSTPKPKKHKYGTQKNVLLTDDEYSKLQERFPTDYEEKINTLSEGLALKGYKYKSHFLAVIKWAQNEKPKKAASTNPFLDMLGEC
jgi:hypothetical protein